MNKKVVIAGASVLALCGAHTGFWVYQSGKIKSGMEQMMQQISKEVGTGEASFSYASSEISGYPLAFTVKISEPKFTSNDGTGKLELLASQDKMVVSSNLLGSSYRISLPSNIDIKQVIGDKEQNYKLEFKDAAPQLSFKLSGNLMSSGRETAEIIPYLSEKLIKFTYLDSGYSLFDKAADIKIASSEAASLAITRNMTKPNNVSTAYKLKISKVDHSALFSGGGVAAGAGLWPISANFDFTTYDVRDESGKSSSVDFTVREGDINAASFGLVLKGEVSANGEDIFPFGNLSLKLSNYQGMVDYFGGLVGNAMAQSKIPFFNIKSEKSIDFKKVLYEVASEKSNEDRDILLTGSREKGKSLFIGQKGLMEVVDLLKASAGRQDEQKQDNVSAPSKVIDAVPSAGGQPGLPKVK